MVEHSLIYSIHAFRYIIAAYGTVQCVVVLCSIAGAVRCGEVNCGAAHHTVILPTSLIFI